MMRRAAMVVLVLGFALGTQAELRGRTLVDAIRILQTRGLRILYSSELIKPEMKVSEEPRATEPRAILEEILAPFGLTPRDGEKGTILIVRKTNDVPASGGVQDVAAQLAPAAEPPLFDLGEIVVSPSSWGIFGPASTPSQTINQDDVARTPHIADDLFRMIERLPGAASPDIRSSVHFRGGVEDEVQVVVDGYELLTPFHLEERLFSVLDTELVGSADLRLGAFPVEYGGRMSGVLDVEPASVASTGGFAFGTSFVNTRALGEGTFGNGKGQWIGSLRIGYLDIVLDYIDSDSAYTPRIVDLYGRASYALSDRTLVTLNALGVRDTLDGEEPSERIIATFKDGSVWLNARTAWTRSLDSETVVSLGKSDRDRFGEVYGSYEVRDIRSFANAGFRQAWTWDAGARVQWRGGVDYRWQDGEYDYRAVGVIIPPDLSDPMVIDRDLSPEPSGSALGGWLAGRFAIGPALYAEAGLRWDEQSWTDESQTSPRLSLAWQATPAATLRLAWGQAFQPQRIDELQIEDGVTTFTEAQRSDQWVAALELRPSRGLALRVEAYDKNISNPQPRYQNFLDANELFPESKMDRYLLEADEARSRGVELFARWDPSPRWGGWMSYVWSRSEDRVGTTWVKRPWDQPHSITGNAHRLIGKWTIALAGTWHTGWPTTEVTATWTRNPDGQLAIHPVIGPINDERFPDYLRFDLRVSREVPVPTGSLSAYVEILNLLDRENHCCVEGFNTTLLPGGDTVLEADYDDWLPLVPSFGVMWRFP